MALKERGLSSAEVKPVRGRGLAVGLTSFAFILLQSACTAFMAISGLRLLIGVGSMAAAAAGLRLVDALHGAAIRIPMETIAVAGSLINLYGVWRIRRLRARPASQWRIQSATGKQLRSEWWQVGIAVVSLLLVVAEWAFHIFLFGSI